MSKRAKNRPTYPLMWECVGGSVLKGEDSLQGALRETLEEVGVTLTAKDGKLLFSEIREQYNDINDIWLFNYDGDVSSDISLSDEVEQAIWMDRDDILKLQQENKLVGSLGYFFDKVDK